VYLLDTNVLSERRKGAKSDPGVVSFIDREGENSYLPVQVVGELRSGIEGLRLRNDLRQAKLLEEWLMVVLEEFSDQVLDFTLPCAEVWGALMGVNDQHIVDRQIAAIALVHDLTVVTRNASHFTGTGARVLNPFLADATPAKPIL
jgi:predicted nucleic acid-binding protein